MLVCSGQAINEPKTCLWDVKCGVRGKGQGLKVKLTMSKPLDPAVLEDDVIELHVFIPVEEENYVIENLFSNIDVGIQAIRLMEISSVSLKNNGKVIENIQMNEYSRDTK